MFHNVAEDEIVKGPITITHTLNDTALSIAYRVAGYTIRGREFRGVEVPNLDPPKSPDEKGSNINPTKVQVQAPDNKPFRAIGDEGVDHVDDLTKEWNNIKEFNPNDYTDKKFHSIHATKDEVKDHTDVWNKHIAELLRKVAQATT
jgi:hypothetical protein